ncbi:hypothetical protein MNBD_UNCLBAC01-762 [hydrothermal vent metagenome]|uniref:Glycosyltransferase 2-like domain-containing protein n=1 Tax=hydrothermal vent metagenome TaxID=652676 RepID=A0A3B1DQ53_9ZZZZ
MKICIIVPALNEAATIGKLVQAIKAKNYDVVVIDDGSSDDSGKIAKDLGAVVIRNAHKSGKGASLQKGFDYALKGDYTGIITMDSDGQHDPEDLSVFIDEARKDPNCVITGNRMAQAKGMPWVRFKTNQFMSFLISKACHQKIPDTQCGYRYIGADVLRLIRFRLKSRDFEIETEILMKAVKQGFKVSSVPVKTIYRDEKSKISPFKDTMRFFVYFIKELREPKDWQVNGQ